MKGLLKIATKDGKSTSFIRYSKWILGARILDFSIQTYNKTQNQTSSGFLAKDFLTCGVPLFENEQTNNNVNDVVTSKRSKKITLYSWNDVD